ncbi:hypothetical protein FBY22_4954 [Streptomyces sp. SLBN-31]|nr:hypothetical protein FBY22_4954 [Streptomyces sp. SLBN-31]
MRRRSVRRTSGHRLPPRGQQRSDRAAPHGFRAAGPVPAGAPTTECPAYAARPRSEGSCGGTTGRRHADSGPRAEHPPPGRPRPGQQVRPSTGPPPTVPHTPRGLAQRAAPRTDRAAPQDLRAAAPAPARHGQANRSVPAQGCRRPSGIPREDSYRELAADRPGCAARSPGCRAGARHGQANRSVPAQARRRPSGIPREDSYRELAADRPGCAARSPGCRASACPGLPRRHRQIRASEPATSDRLTPPPLRQWALPGVPGRRRALMTRTAVSALSTVIVKVWPSHSCRTTPSPRRTTTAVPFSGRQR